MLFNSVDFLIFFPIVVILHFAIPHRFRWILLLFASYYFYMSWRPEYIILIVLSTLVDFFAARQMVKPGNEGKRKKFLMLSLVVNLGMLFFFKYFNFFSSSLQTLFDFVGINIQLPVLTLLLPVGISFYTFQTLSYTIDVYRGKQKPTNQFGIFALFVSFFPQLVAGPIERSTHLLPQFNKIKTIDYKRITDGLKLMGWGLFKKVVIADRLAEIVNNIYNNPTDYSGIPLIIATAFFAIQIYCDFSGYTDIAIGAAKVLGYDLMENFRQPYFSRSIAEFWHRWHISLSTWFRDYLYIPLGGNRVVKWRWYFNVFMVFLISGLWHGANWTFVIWGALHGAFMLVGIWTENSRKQLYKSSGLDRSPFILHTIQMIVTVILVCFAWIFFRANSISDAIYISTHLFSGLDLSGSYGLDLGGLYERLLLVFSMGTLLLVDFAQARDGNVLNLSNKPVVVRWAVYYALFLGIVMFGKFGIQDFIYFQF